MKRHRDTGHILRRVWKALPALFLVSLLSVLVARYLFHIPEGQVAVAAGVPLISLYLLRRLLLDFLPAPPDANAQVVPRHRPPFWVLVFGVTVFLSVLACIASLISAGLYKWVGYASFAQTSLHISLATLFIGVIAVVAVLVTALWERICYVILDISKTVFLDIPRFFTNPVSLRHLHVLIDTFIR
jgi:hypothetical protein